MGALAVPYGGGPTVSPQLPLHGLRLLLVDDDDDIRDVLEMSLVSLGATVVSASSAADARARLRKFHPDLLLSDIFMPGEDGAALLTTIRGMPQFREVQAVAITAATLSPMLRARLNEAGFQSVLAKPFRIDQLQRLIHKVVRAA